MKCQISDSTPWNQSNAQLSVPPTLPNTTCSARLDYNGARLSGVEVETGCVGSTQALVGRGRSGDQGKQ